MTVKNFSSKRKTVLAAMTIVGVATIIAACGRGDAPSCSAPEVEDLVAKLIFESIPMYFGGTYYSPFTKSSTWYIVKKNQGGTALVIIADVKNLIQSDRFTFDGERERGYDRSIRKRSCAADISGSLDEAKLSEAIRVRSEATLLQNAGDASDGIFSSLGLELGQGKLVLLSQNDQQDAQSKFERHALEILKAVRWGSPQNYAVQVTDKGDIYVTIDE